MMGRGSEPLFSLRAVRWHADGAIILKGWPWRPNEYTIKSAASIAANAYRHAPRKRFTGRLKAWLRIPPNVSCVDPVRIIARRRLWNLLAKE